MDNTPKHKEEEQADESTAIAKCYLNFMSEHGQVGHRSKITDNMNAPAPQKDIMESQSTANSFMIDIEQGGSILDDLEEGIDQCIQDNTNPDGDAPSQLYNSKPAKKIKQDSDQADFVSFSSLKNLSKSSERHHQFNGWGYHATHLSQEPMKSVKHDGSQSDLISFSSLKNLDAAKITKSSIDRYPQDSHSCDYDTLYEIQRQPADLTKFCTTSTSRNTSLTYKAYRDLLEAPVKPKANIVVDAASLFYNNFFG